MLKFRLEGWEISRHMKIQEKTYSGKKFRKFTGTSLECPKNRHAAVRVGVTVVRGYWAAQDGIGEVDGARLCERELEGHGKKLGDNLRVTGNHWQIWTGSRLTRHVFFVCLFLGCVFKRSFQLFNSCDWREVRMERPFRKLCTSLDKKDWWWE